MSSYQDFPLTRTTPVRLDTLNRALKVADPTMGVVVVSLGDPVTSTPGSARVKKATPWTAPQIAAAQIVLDTVQDPTPQQTAQLSVDAWPIEFKALVLALIDQFNVVRAALPVPLPPITPAQALAAIRTKAGTL